MIIDIITARRLVISGIHALITTDQGLRILLILPFDESPPYGFRDMALGDCGRAERSSGFMCNEQSCGVDDLERLEASL